MFGCKQGKRAQGHKGNRATGDAELSKWNGHRPEGLLQEKAQEESNVLNKCSKNKNKN